VRAGCAAKLCHVLHLVREVAARRWRRERLSILAVERNGFLYDLTKLLKDSLFVRTVAPAIYQTRRVADIALIFLRPLDNLCISRSIFHMVALCAVSVTVSTRSTGDAREVILSAPIHPRGKGDFNLFRLSVTMVLASMALSQTWITVHAQSYPAKPIRYIVLFPPGGGSDLVARSIAQKLTESGAV
jgi:hypothetical protein